MGGDTDLSFDTGRRGRRGEAIGGEGESGGLKKKGSPIGSCWSVFISWSNVQLNEANESRSK
jgi:hypothetical protein